MTSFTDISGKNKIQMFINRWTTSNCRQRNESFKSVYFPNHSPIETITILFWHYLVKFWLVWKYKLIKFSLITLIKLRRTPEKIGKIVTVFLFWWENWEKIEIKKEIKIFNAENMWHFFEKKNIFWQY